MPLKGIPASVTPELLYALARAGHGDKIVIADANFPSSTIAATSPTCREPISITGRTTAQVLQDVLVLLPLDQYMTHPLQVMDRVDSDKQRNLHVPAYAALAAAAGMDVNNLQHLERYQFYSEAKNAFVVIRTDDSSLYANAILYKGVIS